jgi:hypothetical protein
VALRLGGWYRLWILASVCYGIVVIGIAVQLWPKGPDVANSPASSRVPSLSDFILKQPNDLRDSFESFDYVGADAAGYSAHEIADYLAKRDGRLPTDVEESYVRLRSDPQLFPPDNRSSAAVHELNHSSKAERFSARDLDALAEKFGGRDWDYDPAADLRERRLFFALTTLAVWVTPCLALLIIGLATSWVYRGFREHQQTD